jgi:predicted nucleotidyltransferase/HEPN domain-containing protein
MKTSLDHLPDRKQEQLRVVVSLLREAAPVEMVVLFGSHARGDWVEDPITGYESDFDILVVVASPAVADRGTLWAEIENRAEALPEMTPVNIIVHDFKFVNKALERGQYFFADIAEEGVLLFDSGAFTLTARRAPTPAQRRAQAEEDFEHWSTSAAGFFQVYEFALHQQHAYNIAAFQLHQATERYFAAFLLTFTAYKPRTHNIEKLANQAASLHPIMRAALPRAAGEDRRLFDLLKKAYIDARYSKKYRITAEELSALGERVRDLGSLVERACREKIASLAAEAGGQGPLGLG